MPSWIIRVCLESYSAWQNSRGRSARFGWNHQVFLLFIWLTRAAAKISPSTRYNKKQYKILRVEWNNRIYSSITIQTVDPLLKLLKTTSDQAPVQLRRTNTQQWHRKLRVFAREEHSRVRLIPLRNGSFLPIRQRVCEWLTLSQSVSSHCDFHAHSPAPVSRRQKISTQTKNKTSPSSHQADSFPV